MILKLLGEGRGGEREEREGRSREREGGGRRRVRIQCPEYLKGPWSEVEGFLARLVFDFNNN